MIDHLPVLACMGIIRKVQYLDFDIQHVTFAPKCDFCRIYHNDFYQTLSIYNLSHSSPISPFTSALGPYTFIIQGSVG